VADWLRRDGTDWLISVHAQPGASRSAIVGPHGDALKVRIAAPALEGRANAELQRFVAAALGVPKRSVQLERGDASRQKLLRVSHSSLDEAALRAALKA
jgi:uncharacterized protein (TIGR00251 family)